MLEPQKPDTPNLDKLEKQTVAYNAIAEFLEWLMTDSKMYIAEYGEEVPSRLWHTCKNLEDIIYEYLQIDRKLVDGERQKLLDWIRGKYENDNRVPEITMAVTIGDEEQEII